jgi:hypothetical protein
MLRSSFENERLRESPGSAREEIEPRDTLREDHHRVINTY